MLFAEQCRSGAGSLSSRIRGLEDQASLDNLRQFLEVFQQSKRNSPTNFVSLLVSRKMIYGLVERRIRRDGDARVALKSSSSKDVDLDSGAIEGGIGRRRGAMEDEDWQISKVRVGGVVETDLVLRQGQLVCDPNHLESSLMASPGPSMGLALHDDKTSKVSGQFARVLKFVSLDVVNLLKVNIRLGVTGWLWKNKSTRRACPVYFAEDARTSRIKAFGHTKLDGASAAAASRMDLSN